MIAATPPPIDLGRAPAAIIRRLAPIAFHNTSAVRVQLVCNQTTPRRARCILRGWNRHGRRVILERITVRAVRSHRARVFEDYSGWIRYVPTHAATPSTLYLDPS